MNAKELEMLKGYVHSLESFGSVDGPGVRYVIFLSGCAMRCQFCHNPDTWNMTDGKEYTTDQLLKTALRFKSYWGDKGGITVSGGEPLLQMDFLTELFRKAKEAGVHTTLDTSGNPYTTKEPWHSKWLELMKYTDLLLLDIKQLYHKEYEIGLELLKKVNEMFEVDLSADEAGFFALHFVNAEDGGKTDSYQISIIVHQILDIVEKYYDNMEFQEDNLYYQRFLTHLKYFAQRFLHKELHYDENQELFKIIKEQYREAYGCVKMIYLMMEEEYKYAMTEDEMLYLTIHIQKITEDHKRLKNL